MLPRPADAPISQFWFTNDAARVSLKVRRALRQPRLRLEIDDCRPSEEEPTTSPERGMMIEVRSERGAAPQRRAARGR